MLNVQLGNYGDKDAAAALLGQTDVWVKDGHKVNKLDRVEWREDGSVLKWFPAGRQTPISLEIIAAPDEWSQHSYRGGDGTRVELRS